MVLIFGSQVIGFPNMYSFLKYEHEKHRRTPKEHTYTLKKDRRVSIELFLLM